MCCDVLAYTERTVVCAVLHGTLPVLCTVPCLSLNIWAYTETVPGHIATQRSSLTHNSLGCHPTCMLLACVSMFGVMLPSKEADCSNAVLRHLMGTGLPTPESLHASCMQTSTCYVYSTFGPKSSSTSTFRTGDVWGIWVVSCFSCPGFWPNKAV